jgi:TetR/AcrR family fatty acid metabolism transcriptional regulator
MEKKLTTRDKQAIATKNKIYEVGIELLQKQGFDQVNVSQIAKSAGVSVGTFYHYYTSKLDLFMDLYRTADTYYEETISQRLSGLSFQDQIILFFREYCQLAETNGVELTGKMYVPDNTLFLGRSQGMRQVLLEIIELAMDEGCIKWDAREAMDGSNAHSTYPDSSEALSQEGTAQQMADDLFLIARGVIFDWALRSGEYDLKEKMEDMLTIYMRHI